MDKLKQSMETQPEDVTRSPQLNAVISEIRRFFDGMGNVEALHEKVEELDLVVNQMIRLYNYEIRFQEKTKNFLRESEIIDTNFKSLKKHLEEIKKYFKQPKEEYLTEGLKGCKSSFENLFNSFDRLKDKEQQRKTYSRSGFLNEVMRVGYCVIDGTLPADAFKERLEAFIKIQEDFLRNFENIKPVEEERMIIEENRSKIKQNLKDLLDGLYEAKLYLKDSKAEHIRNGLEKANKAADFLVDLEEKLKSAREAPKVKYCFKCGAENPRNVKYCVNCNFNFPPLQIVEESTVDVQLAEGGIKETGHIMTENLMKLTGAVEDIRHEKISMEEYLKTIGWLSDLVQNSKKEAAKIKEPEDPQDPEAKEAFENFKEIFFQGISDMEMGLENLKMYAENRDPNLLETGIERTLLGGDKLFQVQAIGEQLRAASMAQRKT